MNRDTRLALTDTPQDIVMKMCDGNPGALGAMMDVIRNGDVIDPQDCMGGLGPVLHLDGMGIYGTDIYILYNDQCNQDVRKFIMLLRACQLGFISKEKIKEIAGDQCRQYLLTDDEMCKLDELVVERLDEFQRK